MLRKVVLSIAAMALLCSCSDSLNDINPPGSDGMQASLIDGARGGNAHFFLLPPLAKQPTYSGQFDGSLAKDLTVQVCEWTGTACARIVSTAPAKLEGDHYAADWNSSAAIAGLTYRAEVLAAGTLIGVADLKVVAKGSDLKNIDAGQFIGVVRGSTLPIKFRVEKGAVSVIDPAQGGTVQAGSVALQIPAGATSGNVGITVDTVAGSGPVIGEAVELGPTGLQFSAPVTLTMSYDPSTATPQNLGIYWFDPAKNVWVLLPGAVVDPSAHTISVQISHFSKYGHGARMVDSIAIAPNRVRVGGTAAIAAQALDVNGAVVATPITYATSNAGVLVSSNDTIKGIAHGTAQLTATAGSKTSSIAVDVYQTIDSVSVSPASAHASAFGGKTSIIVRTFDAAHARMSGTSNTVAVDDDSVGTASFTDDSTLVITGGSGKLAKGADGLPIVAENVHVTRWMMDGTIRIEKAITIPFHLDPAVPNITVKGAAGVYGNNVTLNATMQPCVPMEQITFSLDGVDVATGQTDTNCGATATYQIAAAPGKHVIGARAVANSYTQQASGADTLTVMRAPIAVIAQNVDAVVYGSYTLSAQTTPALPNLRIDFSLNGAALGQALTGSDGIATLSGVAVQGPSGSRAIHVFAEQSANYDSTSTTATLNVTAAPSNVVLTGPDSAAYGSDAAFTAVMTPAVAGRTIHWHAVASSGNASGDAQTDSTGTAHFTYHVSAFGTGSSIQATVTADSYVQQSAASSLPLTVTPGHVDVPDLTVPTGAFTITARSPVAAQNQSLIFSVIGVRALNRGFAGDTVIIGAALTNADGVAQASWNLSGLAPGSYTMLVTSQAAFAPLYGTGALTVTKLPTSIRIAAASASYLEPVTLSASVTPPASGSATFTVNGESLAAVAVEAGNASTTWTPTSIGTFAYSVTYSGDGTHLPSSDTASIVVSAASTTLTVQSGTNTIGDVVTLVAHTNPAIPGIDIDFTLNGIAKGRATTDAQGVASLPNVTVTAPAGTQTILATPVPSNTFTAQAASAVLTVKHATSTLSVTVPSNAKVDSAIVLQARLTNALPATIVHFRIDSTEVGSSAIDANGAASFGATAPDSRGNHILKAYTDANDTYAAATANGTFSVTGITPTISTTSVSGVVGDSVTLQATMSGASGTIKFLVGIPGYNQVLAGTAVTDGNGVATLKYQINGGLLSEPILAQYDGDGTHEPASASGTLTVLKRTVLTVSLVPSPYGQQSFINGAVVYQVTGTKSTLSLDHSVTVHVTYNGRIVASGGTNGGSFNIRWSPPRAGKLPITISFDGDDTYSPAAIDTVLDVSYVTLSNGTVSGINIFGTSMVGDTATFQTKATPAAANRAYQFKVNGVDVGTAISGSDGFASLKYLIAGPAGAQTVSVSFAGDTAYNPWSTQVGWAVKKGSVSFVGATPEAVAEGSPLTLTARSSGKVVANATVKFSTQSNTPPCCFTDVGSAVTDSTGLATITITAPVAGSYTYFLSFAGNTSYIGSADLGTGFTSIPAAPDSIRVTSLARTDLRPFTATAQLYPSRSSRSVAFTMTDAHGVQSSHTAVTDASGKASFSFDPDADGTYTYTASLMGVTSDSATVSVLRPTAPLSIQGTLNYGDSSTVTATLTGAPNRSVRLLIDSTVVGTASTNASGVATFTYTPETWTSRSVTAQFDGDDFFEPATATVTLPVNLLAMGSNLTLDTYGTLQFNDTIALIATLISERNNPIANHTVTFSRNDGTSLGSAQTDATGHATFHVALTTAGSNTFRAVYAGDDTFTVSNASKTIIVAAAPMTLVTSAATGTYGTPGALTATMSPAAAGKLITFTVGSIAAGTATTDSAGTATLNYTPSATGPLNYSASFAGDAQYNSATSSAVLTVARATSSIVLSMPTEMVTGQTYTLTFTLSPGVANQTIRIWEEEMDQRWTVTTNSQGVATLTYTASPKPDAIFHVDYDGNVNYKASEASVQILNSN